MHTKSELFQDKLQQLTQFNQALVYGFDPESSRRHILGSNTWEDHLFPGAGQYEDMLAGYLFAQNELLPAFKEGSLDENSFVNYIKRLHGYIGKTLLATEGKKSGEYSQEQVLRWNPDVTTDGLIYLILSGTTHPVLKGNDPTTVLVDLLTTKLSLSKAQVLQFIALLERLKNDSTLTPRASQEQFLENDIPSIATEKLVVAYLSNKLSVEEKELVSKIVTICRDPEDTPKLMENFAKSTLANWRKCDKNDIKAVSQCLAEMFFQFTDIHPFGNANGRTGGCLINVFLRSIGLPSILMRNPGEKKDSSSSYTLAIDAINETREPLANHIYQRILAAQSQAFADEKLAEVTISRCKLAHQLQLLKSKHPQNDINKYQQTMDKFCSLPEVATFPNRNDQFIFIFKKLLPCLAEEEKRLDQSLSKGKTTVTGFIGTTILSDGEKEQLKQDLSTLTNNTGWKINPKNHLDSWMETPDQSEAERVSKLLHAAGVGKVSKGMRSDNNQIHVVKCLNINLSELKNKIKSNNAAEAATSNSAEENNASVSQ